jgi:hypothetical protein
MPTSGLQCGVLTEASPLVHPGARAAFSACCLVDPFASVRLAGRFFCTRVRLPCRRRGPPGPSLLPV